MENNVYVKIKFHYTDRCLFDTNVEPIVVLVMVFTHIHTQKGQNVQTLKQA